MKTLETLLEELNDIMDIPCSCSDDPRYLVCKSCQAGHLWTSVHEILQHGVKELCLKD